MLQTPIQSTLRKLKLFRGGMIAVAILTPLVAAGYIGSHQTGWDIVGGLLIGLFYIPMYAAATLIILAVGYAKQRSALTGYAALPRRETWLRLTYTLLGWFSLSFALSLVVFFLAMVLVRRTI